MKPHPIVRHNLDGQTAAAAATAQNHSHIHKLAHIRSHSCTRIICFVIQKFKLSLDTLLALFQQYVINSNSKTVYHFRPIIERYLVLCNNKEEEEEEEQGEEDDDDNDEMKLKVTPFISTIYASVRYVCSACIVFPVYSSLMLVQAKIASHRFS